MTAKVYTKADNKKFSKVIEYRNGTKVEIPINKDGSVRWFDDNQLIKPKAESKK